MAKICEKCGAESLTEWKGKLCNKCFQAWKKMMQEKGLWKEKERPAGGYPQQPIDNRPRDRHRDFRSSDHRRGNERDF